MLQVTEAILVVNTRARRGDDLFEETRNTLAANGVSVSEAWGFRDHTKVLSKISEAIARDVPLVIVGGGDGTLSGAARLFVGSKSVLGVMPLGTGNMFARDLGIEPNINAACKVLALGRAASVDIGIAGKSSFLNIATIGLTTLIAQDLVLADKHRLGNVAYGFAIARAMLQVRPFRVTLTMPEGKKSFNALQVVIGNGRFHAGPFPVGPKATIIDGKLTAYVVATTKLWGLVRYALSLPGGRQSNLEEVHTFTTTQIKLETTPSRRITVDGEVLFRTPLTFSVSPGALRVMVPEAFGA